MRTADIITRAGRNLRQAKVRTLLTALAISVGAFTIMLSLATAEGARQYADKLISSNVDPNAVFIVKDDALTGGGQPKTGFQEYNPDTGIQNGLTIDQFNQSDIDALKKRTDIKDVRPLFDVSATYLMVSGNDKKYTSELNVYNPDVLSDVAAGSLPKLGTDIGDGDVVVPSGSTEKLGISDEDLVGRTITLVVERPIGFVGSSQLQDSAQSVVGMRDQPQVERKEIKLKVIAVAKASQLSFASSTAVLIPISVAQTISDFTSKGTNAYHKYFAATAKTNGNNTPQQVKQNLQATGLHVQTAKDLQGFLFVIINVILGIVGGFGVIALIASVFGIINTQYISVLERTSQIGLMKALGMRSRHVSRLFRYEAAWIGFLGGVIGVFTAWLIGTLFNPTITKSLDLGEGTRLLIFVPWHAAVLVLCLMIIAVVAGYFPSRKAAKLDPIEALRTE